MKKTCTLCLIEKPTSEFHVCRSSTSGLQTRCKSCKAQLALERFQKLKPERAALQLKKQEAQIDAKKLCFGCKSAKETSEFNSKSSTKDGLQSYCRPCMRRASEASIAKRPEHYREASRIGSIRRYYENRGSLDKVAARARCRKFFELHPERIKAHKLKFVRTPKGWVCTALQGMRQKSKRRGHPPPELNSVRAVAEWIQTTDFEKLWNAYVASGFETNLKPSIDRFNNDLPYLTSNIRLVTWRENLLAWNQSEEGKERARIGCYRRAAFQRLSRELTP